MASTTTSDMSGARLRTRRRRRVRPRHLRMGISRLQGGSSCSCWIWTGYRQPDSGCASREGGPNGAPSQRRAELVVGSDLADPLDCVFADRRFRWLPPGPERRVSPAALTGIDPAALDQVVVEAML